MTVYNSFDGGNRRKTINDSTLASGLQPFAEIGYAAHVARSEWCLKQTFDGNTEAWQYYLERETADGKGFYSGDMLTMALADPNARFNGATLILKKDLPSNIGLKLSIISNAADGKDSFVAKSVTIAAGSTAGTAYLPPSFDAADFSVAGLSAVVTFTGTDTTDPLVLRNVCFEVGLAITDFNSYDDCVCAGKNCPADYPEPLCGGLPYVSNVSGFSYTGAASAQPSGD